MKYEADRGYTDLQLKRHVDKDENLEEIYEKAGVELTEERIKYLVEERKLYVSVEEIPEGNIKDITPVDEIPEGEKVIDRVDIIEDNKEEIVEDNKEETTETEESKEEIVEDNKEETTETEESKEETVEDNKEDKTKNNNKRTTKTSTKNEEK